MSKHDFFVLLIRLVVAYSAIMMIGSIPQNLMISFPTNSDSVPFILIMLAYYAAVLAFMLFIIRWTPNAVKLLGLHRGYETENIMFKDASPRSITTIAVLILGGYLIITNVPDFFSGIYEVMSENQLNAAPIVRSARYWISTIMEGLSGLLMITNVSWISGWLVKKMEASMPDDDLLDSHID